MNIELVGIFGYLIIQLLIGAYVLKRNKTEQDYFLAGRGLSLPMATFSIFATWFGAETCLGSSGIIFSEGLSGSTADPFGYTICLVLMGVFFAARLWKKNLTTLGDLYKAHYSVSVEKLAVLLMIPTSMLWAAAQIRAFGQVLSASSGLEIKTAILIATGLVIAYTVMGGLLADVITDMVQGVALILGLVVLFGVLIYDAGGVGSVLQAIDPEKLSFMPKDGTFMSRIEAWAIPIAGSLVAQELVARVIATKNPTIAKRSTLFAASGYLLVGLIPVAIALFAHIFITTPLDEPEQLLPILAKSHLPTVMYVIFAGALVSAILSTVDSTLLAVSSLMSHNILLPALKITDERKKVRLARICVVAAGLGAFGMAFYSDGIYDLVETASAFGSSGILVITIFALSGNFGSPISAFVTLISGVVSMYFAEYVLEIEAPYVFSILAAFVTFVGTEFFIRALGFKQAETSEANG